MRGDPARKRAPRIDMVGWRNDSAVQKRGLHFGFRAGVIQLDASANIGGTEILACGVIEYHGIR